MLQRVKSQWEPFYLFVVYILSEKFGFSIESPPPNYGPLFLFYSPCIQIFFGGEMVTILGQVLLIFISLFLQNASSQYCQD